MEINLEQSALDYRRIEGALHYLQLHRQRHPELREVAEAVGMSEYHFQRLFSRWVGISPKRFLQFLTKEHARRLLQESRDLLSTAYEAGLSGPGRLHDLFVSCEAMTPGEFKNGGAGLTIRYGFSPSPFGNCLLAVTDRGICHLGFPGEAKQNDAIQDLRRQWPSARFVEDHAGAAALVHRIFSASSRAPQVPLHLLLKGTNFQIKVWEALLRIPAGCVVSYQDVAGMIGKPRAVRAVAGAVAHNPIAFLIPCHRVIRKMGVIHEYRWGKTRKEAILGWEAARHDPQGRAQRSLLSAPAD